MILKKAFAPTVSNHSHYSPIMEKQRSFSIKATKNLVLSVTVVSSLTFFIYFSIWLFKSTSSVPQQIHFHFNAPSQTINSSGFVAQPPILTNTHFEELQVQGGFAKVSSSEAVLRNKSGNEVFLDEQEEEDSNANPGERYSIPASTHLKKPENVSRFANNLSFEEILRNKRGTEVSADEREEEDSDANPSEINSIPEGTHHRKPENISGFARNLVFERLHRISNVSIQVLDLDTTTISDALSGNDLRPSKQNESVTSLEKAEISNNESRSRICDFTKGRWEYDDRLPLYTNESCPFIDEGFDCEGNGRSDKEYMKWRWQLQDCEIPRFNATQMLEIIRGKRLVFVGDSINRNQWESMLCLLLRAIKDRKRVYETHGRRITKEKGDYIFKFVDYKCTVEYYVTHFLVHESKARVGKKRVQTLRIDTMDRGSSRWKGADFIVFNTAHWWTHSKTKSGINYYQEGDQVHPHLDASVAFRRALTTWASWVDRHINPQNTHVFFRTSSPSHFNGGQWNSGGHCKEATQPLLNLSAIKYSENNDILKEVFGGMKTPVTILNITRMSEYRIDGHPSLHGRKKISKRPSSNIQDCSHWCLPGVPDNWNELLYSNLYLKTRGTLYSF